MANVPIQGLNALLLQSLLPQSSQSAQIGPPSLSEEIDRILGAPLTPLPTAREAEPLSTRQKVGLGIAQAVNQFLATKFPQNVPRQNFIGQELARRDMEAREGTQQDLLRALQDRRAEMERRRGQVQAATAEHGIRTAEQREQARIAREDEIARRKEEAATAAEQQQIVDQASLVLGTRGASKILAANDPSTPEGRQAILGAIGDKNAAREAAAEKNKIDRFAQERSIEVAESLQAIITGGFDAAGAPVESLSARLAAAKPEEQAAIIAAVRDKIEFALDDELTPNGLRRVLALQQRIEEIIAETQYGASTGAAASVSGGAGIGQTVDTGVERAGTFLTDLLSGIVGLPSSEERAAIRQSRIDDERLRTRMRELGYIK